MSSNDRIEIPYLITGQYERLDEINNRMYMRNVAEGYNLRPNFDFRSTPTRYVNAFPIIDPRKTPIVPIQNSSPNETPVGTRGPVMSYFMNVNKESDLRNQNSALQHGAPQGFYIPYSTSDLYVVQKPTVSHPVVQTHPDLFRRDETYRTTGNSTIQEQSIGTEVFFNNTRVQLRT
jgi:hypothetical protein